MTTDRTTSIDQLLSPSNGASDSWRVLSVLKVLGPISLLIGFFFGTPVFGQIPDASGVALGLGDNFTALARGRNAVSWNPAGLGLSGSPWFSISVAPLRGTGAIGPVGPKDLVEVGERLMTHQEKTHWLERIGKMGRQRGTLGLDATYLSLNLGRIGFQLSTRGAANLDLSPGAAELLLFGNAGLTGEPRRFTFDDSGFTVALTSTAALSYGHPLELIAGHELALGITLKYTIGHALLSGQDRGSFFDNDPLSTAITFPIVHTDTTGQLNNGQGFGLDLGAAWSMGPFRAGLALQNLINTFSWDEANLFYNSGSAIVTSDTTGSDFESRHISEASPLIRTEAKRLAEDSKYRPQLALGAAYTPIEGLTLVGELRHRWGEVIRAESATHLGLGAEYRLLSFLPIRGGLARIEGGHQVSGGIGLEFGIIEIGLSGAVRGGDAGEGGIGMFVVSFGR